MNDRKVKVAIIGLGFGAEFIPIYQKHPNADMHAICQRTDSNMNEIGDVPNGRRSVIESITKRAEQPRHD